MIATLLGIIAWLLRLASTVLLIYCIMTRHAGQRPDAQGRLLCGTGAASFPAAALPLFSQASGHFPWTCPRWRYGW